MIDLNKLNNAKKGTIKGASLSVKIGVVLIILKLTGVINWSWLWITIPFWGPPIFVVIAVMIGLVLFKIFIKKVLKNAAKKSNSFIVNDYNKIDDDDVIDI